MKRFRFRLEPVRAIRALAERSAREAFGAAQRAHTQALDAQQAATRRRDALARDLAAAFAGTFHPATQAEGLHALNLARQAELEAIRAADAARAARDQAHQAWIHARRRLQVIERLEERARRAHREAAEKAEQTALDELASIAAARLRA